MTRLINIDNGGTLTDICVIDGDEVRYTKTLTTPFDLSRCVFDGLTKASALLYGEERLPSLRQSTDYVRYSTTQGTNALVQRKGPRLGLLVTDPGLIGQLTSGPAQRELLEALVGDRWASVRLASDEELTAELVTTINDLAGRGASRLVVSIGGEAGRPRNGASAACCCGNTRGICWVRCPWYSPGSCSAATATMSAAPGPACSTRSCIRRWSDSCSAPSSGCASTAPAGPCSSSATTAGPLGYRSPRRSRPTAQVRAGAWRALAR